MYDDRLISHRCLVQVDLDAYYSLGKMENENSITRSEVNSIQLSKAIFAGFLDKFFLWPVNERECDKIFRANP